MTTTSHEILRTAYYLGYYEAPKRCTLQDVADRVGLPRTVVHRRLTRIESAVVEAYIGRIQKGAMSSGALA